METDTECPNKARARFVRKCVHDPGTGCVIWTGGKTAGGGHSVYYGAFWFAGKRWYAHRWAAKYIHGLDVDGLQVDHFCPSVPRPNTLCVEHVRPVTLQTNRELQALIGRDVLQSLEERRRYWACVRAGIEPPPTPAPEPFTLPPYFPVPDWLDTVL